MMHLKSEISNIEKEHDSSGMMKYLDLEEVECSLFTSAVHPQKDFFTVRVICSTNMLDPLNVVELGLC